MVMPMRSIGVFLNSDDERAYIADLLSKGYHFLPEILYDEPNLQYASDIDAYLKFKRTTKMFWAFLPEFVQSPFELKYLEKKEKYYVIPMWGGPALHVCIPAPYKKGESWILPSGLIGYHPKYMCSRTQTLISVPRTSTLAFSKILRDIKKWGTKIQNRTVIDYVFAGALKDSQSGRIILDTGQLPSGV